jgi:hypothetical protein
MAHDHADVEGTLERGEFPDKVLDIGLVPGAVSTEDVSVDDHEAGHASTSR